MKHCTPASPLALRHARIALLGALAAHLGAEACKTEAPIAAASVAPAVTDLPWSASAVPFRSRVGATLTVRCPPGGAPATVWGTDLYSDDSSICTAALHAGRVSLQAGGEVRITVAPGAARYQGSVRNQITTRSFGAYPGSFTVTDGPAPGLVATPVPEAVSNPWADTATRFRGRNGEPIRVVCPGGGTPAAVWGTEVYTDDSSVCTAALHAGRINPAGGTVLVYPRPGQTAYRGSARNGVETRDFRAFPGSFAFDPNATGEPAADGSIVR